MLHWRCQLSRMQFTASSPLVMLAVYAFLSSPLEPTDCAGLFSFPGTTAKGVSLFATVCACGDGNADGHIGKAVRAKCGQYCRRVNGCSRHYIVDVAELNGERHFLSRHVIHVHKHKRCDGYAGTGGDDNGHVIGSGVKLRLD